MPLHGACILKAQAGTSNGIIIIIVVLGPQVDTADDDPGRETAPSSHGYQQRIRQMRPSVNHVADIIRH